jgi:hypothetical protein
MKSATLWMAGAWIIVGGSHTWLLTVWTDQNRGPGHRPVSGGKHGWNLWCDWRKERSFNLCSAYRTKVNAEKNCTHQTNVSITVICSKGCNISHRSPHQNQEQTQHKNKRPHDKYTTHSKEKNSIMASHLSRQEETHIKTKTNKIICK